MKQICCYKELTGQQTDPSILSGHGKHIDEKQIILDYLNSFEAEAVQTRAMTDYFTNISLPDSVECFTDGEYIWTSEDVYHFEKYDIELNRDFIEYVLNRPE